MGHYNPYQQRTSMRNRPWKIHPIWRGIGCLLVFIFPFIAFAGAHTIVDMNLRRGWMAVPPEMSGSQYIPYVNFSINHFFADLLVMALLLLLGFAAIMFIYTIVYSLLGPSRYGPLDAPPPRKRSKSQKRR